MKGRPATRRTEARGQRQARVPCGGSRSRRTGDLPQGDGRGWEKASPPRGGRGLLHLITPITSRAHHNGGTLYRAGRKVLIGLKLDLKKM